MFSVYATQFAALVLPIVPSVAAEPLLGLALLVSAWQWFGRGDEVRVQAVQHALTRSRTALAAL